MSADVQLRFCPLWICCVPGCPLHYDSFLICTPGAVRPPPLSPQNRVSLVPTSAVPEQWVPASYGHP